ncbi:TonB-dependent receptor [Novosphingobium naphthalenivorans]|uniref:TonB-dependent receptor n=1 Tax=Novosphingobium naphthalenivorans TaxID=273168 RepID=UPI0008314C71|nr:TonB-dependent receptor [Novosphingobium naphthalenivorans]
MKTSSTISTASALLAGAAVLAFAAPALAQTSPDGDGKSTEADGPSADSQYQGEIVVTAQGRKQSLQDVPIAVTVTSGEALARANIGDLTSLGNHVAGVKLAGAPAADILTIRGVGSGINPGFEQAVGTFVDGVYRGRARSMRASLFDIDRVEILKGPQTTFFGNNTIGGAFNITTRKPGHDFAVNASALYGNFGQYAVEAGVDVPLTSTLSGRVSGRAYGMNGYIKNSFTGNDGPHQRDWIGRVSLVWEPGDSFKSEFRFDRARMRDSEDNLEELMYCPPVVGVLGGLCARYLAQNGGPVDDKLNAETSTYPGSLDYDMSEAVWTNSYDFGAATLSSKSAYFHHNVQLRGNLFPVPVEVIPGKPAALPYYLPERYTNYSEEIRLTSASGTPFTYVLGAYYSHGELHTKLYDGFYFAPLGAAVAPLYSATDPVGIHGTFDQKDDVLSFFASATYNLTDRLRINMGLRYSIVKKTAHRFNETGSSGPGAYLGPDNFIAGSPAQQAALNAVLAADPADFANPKRTDRKLMPTVSVQYDVAPGAMVYASYTKGFKAGGFADSFIPNAFGPENVDSYEVGLKGQFFDRRLTFNVDLFWSDYSDLQESTNVVLTSGAVLQSIQNAAQARSRGVELNTQFRLSDAVRFHADVSYIDAYYTRFPDGPCTLAQTLVNKSCVQDLSGKKRPYAPDWSGSAGIDISLPVGPNVLTFDPSVSFSSSFVEQASNDPLFMQDGYAKLDARLGYGDADGRWELAVIGKNLTDKITSAVRNNVGTSPGTIWALPEMGRSVAVQASIKF